MTKIKVLIVDDSAVVRTVLSRGLNADADIEVVGTAPNPYIARDMIVKLRPDVLTLDVEMPRMDGVEFLRKLMPQWPVPVVIVSSLTQRGKRITLEAMECGAVEVVAKPKAAVADGLREMMDDLVKKVKHASKANVSSWKNRRIAPRPKLQVSRSLEESTDKVIAIGASTGGTEAIRTVVSKFPANSPGVVIVQHMPGGFTKMFADRLNEISAMEVKEAQDNDRVMTGQVLIAPGGYHMEVKRSGGVYRVKIFKGQLVSGHMPSVNVMMHSVAQEVGANAVGVMLTGMGADGALGMKAMKDAGARCIAQDEESSVVFGMPNEAYKHGGAERLVALEDIAASTLSLLHSLK